MLIFFPCFSYGVYSAPSQRYIDRYRKVALGMQGMRLHEIREIYIHPEFVYGAFSNFGSGRAILVKVELLEYTPISTPFHPSHLSVDLAKAVAHSSQGNTLTSLENDYSFFCGKIFWSFYKHKLRELDLNDLLLALESDTILSFEDRETLHKLQWLICAYDEAE